MFHRVGDVHVIAVDAGLGERANQELAGGADKRAAGQILAVAGLLADEDHIRFGRTLAEDRLRGAFI